MHTSFGWHGGFDKIASLFNDRERAAAKSLENRGSAKCLYLSRF
jgi:hypothetical protein